MTYVTQPKGSLVRSNYELRGVVLAALTRTKKLKKIQLIALMALTD
jgi:hypothetical protein